MTSPFEYIYKRKPVMDSLYRFGTLCCRKEFPVEGVKGLDDKGQFGVYLGVSEDNGLPLAGVWRPVDGKSKHKPLRFMVLDCPSIEVYPDYLVSNIEDLKPCSRGIFQTFPTPGTAGGFIRFEEGSRFDGIPARDGDESPSSCSSVSSQDAEEIDSAVKGPEKETIADLISGPVGTHA
jgi:hypothetical protein